MAYKLSILDNMAHWQKYYTTVCQIDRSFITILLDFFDLWHFILSLLTAIPRNLGSSWNRIQSDICITLMT